MTGLEQGLIAAASIVTGGMSLFVGLRRQRSDATAQQAAGLTAQTTVLVDGFGDLVTQLQDEVRRLNLVIADLRKEQEECERRNDEMAVEMQDLKVRIAHLETNGYGSDVS